ncbi:peptidoglycan/xylan/chitin deacetylase (PgdA/CDA1 family) [Actinocorallia herbida]|uniref:Peptidoglycan/xylan/chitin deacetylase (PgdA/CDA1 family) n=1 Tax=Actinocorallia herbida TaxID=58109 RepID=A0A3N1CTJ4_9ACTN|nr:polysaccharide deacetylase family protein [Actinocorallia herbida]ROO84620.1 peptidoglycan/xylan/chitin deacetylase (PgdA/CDA1 family) [Actinocorallia herbida]
MRKLAVAVTAALALVAVLVLGASVAIGMAGLGVVAVVGDVHLLPEGPAPGAGGRSVVPVIAADAEARRGLPRTDAYPHDCAVAKCVALTFDDGPGPYTAELLKTLKDEKVRATFFVLGEKVAENPDVLRATAEAGHQIGNHTWDHRDLTRLDAAAVRSELTRTSDLVRQVAGVRPSVMRPPYGSSDRKVAKELEALGLPEVTWTIDPQDWRGLSRDAVAAKVLKEVQPGEIVLLHDIKRDSVRAVPRIVAELKKRGYVFATVSELLAPAVVTPGVQYRGLL